MAKACGAYLVPPRAVKPGGGTFCIMRKQRERKSLKTGGAVGSYKKEIWDRLFTVTPHISNIVDVRKA